ncbi:hypothetical protein B4U79_17082, partial [Dinothrombium tinctorium]
MLLLTWVHKNENDAPQGKTNIAVSSYVTAYARLELYNLMEKIEKQRPGSVLYHDTDSVLYYKKYTDPVIQCGDFLGDLTDEIVKDYGDARCTKFASLGPKNYSYEIQKTNGETIAPMKIK